MNARDDYPVDSTGEQYETMCDEIDRLRPVVEAAVAWADAEDETLTPGLQDSTDRLWAAVATFRGDPVTPECTCPFRWTTHYRSCPLYDDTTGNESTWREDDVADSYSDERVNEHGNVIDYAPQFGEEP